MRKCLSAVLALTIFAAACSSGAEEIGRVGDTTFTTDDLVALYEPGWFDDDAIVINEERRTDLFRLVAIEALTQAAADDFGFVVDPAEVDTTMEDARAQIAAANVTVAEFLGVAGASEAMLELNSEFGLVRRGVILELIKDEEFLRELYGDGRGVTTVCVRHILVENTTDVDTVVAALEAGGDFATLADEVSTDTATAGGDLGCALAGRYVPEFAEAALEAPIGELTYPVETSYGFHILIVDSRSGPTLEDLLADPSAWVPESEADFLWGDWLNAALRDADASVSPRFGEWTAVGIAPPSE